MTRAGESVAAVQDSDVERPTDADPLLNGRSVAHLQDAGGWLKKRNIMLIMLSAGIMNVYMMRVNLSVASEPMQKHFGWSNSEQGLVLSSFFWGYIAFQIPGGLLASYYGGKQVFGLGVLGTAILTILLPVCAEQSTGLLYGVRALTGFCEGVTFPAMNVLFSHWVPNTERSYRVAVAASTAAYLGNAVALPLSGVIVDFREDDAGVSTSWPYVFYVFGVIGIVWFALWECIVADTPQRHSTISIDERAYLEATTGGAGAAADARADAEGRSPSHADAAARRAALAGTKADVGEMVVKSPTIPWLGFILTPRAWVVFLCHFGHNYLLYTGMTYIPKYLKEQLGFDMGVAGGIAVLPYVVQLVTATFVGVLADWLQQERGWSIRRVRVTSTAVGVTLCAIFLCITGWMENTAVAVFCMSCAVGFSGFLASGYNCSYLDYSPHYTGNFFSIGNVVSNIGGIVAPIIAGDLLGDRDDGHFNGTAPVAYAPEEDLAPASHWRNVFYVAAAIYIVVGLQYCLFVSGKPLQAVN